MSFMCDKIYKSRSAIQNLYENDTLLKGDLINSISEKIESEVNKIEFKIQNKSIHISLNDNNSDSLNHVKSIVESSIQRFILDNIDSINSSDKEDVKEMVQQYPSLLYDIYTIGNNLYYTL